jgi:hypothetical protein
MKKIVGFAFLAAMITAFPSWAAGLDCNTDDKCPCRDWADVLANLEHTANTPGPDNRGCAEVRVRGGETAYDAFKHCNAALGDTNLFGSPQFVGDEYRNCAPYVCNWFPRQKPPWSPAC